MACMIDRTHGVSFEHESRVPNFSYDLFTSPKATARLAMLLN